MNNMLIVYHAGCADGFTAAWAARLVHPDAEYFAASHDGELPNVVGKDVYFLDFCYYPDVMVTLAGEAKSITVLDHHKSAQEGAQHLIDNGTLKGFFDMNRSGAGIAWDYFHPGKPMPKLVRVVQDRDLWKFEDEDTRYLMASIFSFEYTWDNWDYLNYALNKEDGIEHLLRGGEAITRKHNKDVAEYAEKMVIWLTIQGHAVPTLNIPYTHSSEAGHYLCKKFDTGFAACYSHTPHGIQFSLRSNDKVDVSEIARKYGGGGHKNAAGFTLKQGEKL